MSRPSVLVVAKAPVPGLAKTRIARTVGDARAAELAAAALLDTLDAATASGMRVVVAMTGDLARASRRDDLTETLAGVAVVAQRGRGLGARLANAHADADEGHGVVQIGMDSPQVTAADLSVAAAMLGTHRSVLGPATDGGWWLLGVRSADQATVLAGVPMSTDTTGALTREALGGTVGAVRTLNDMDEWSDAESIAAAHPHLRVSGVVHAMVARS